MMMMVSTFMAHDSIHLISKKIYLKKKGIWCSHSQNRWVFKCLRNVTKESASTIVCGRAFQSLGAELEKAQKPNCFLMCFLAALGVCRHGCNEEQRGGAGTYQE